MIPRACSQGESQPCYWYRGLIPQAWTDTPAPQFADDWHVDGLSHGFTADCLPAGSERAPTRVFGDASGGPDTADPRLRRVALGIAVVSQVLGDTIIECSIAGGLAGMRQTVARGELKAFWLCVFTCRGHTQFITDCENVLKGWNA
eukprot:4423103-Pyramimonas_sp.AAC.1